MFKCFRSLFSKQLPLDLILLFTGSTLFLLFFLVARTYFAPQLTYLSLPYSSTLFAVEYSTDLSSDNFKAVARKVGLPNSLRFIDFYEEIYPVFKDLPILNQEVFSKTFSLQKVDQEIQPVLVLTFKNQSNFKKYATLQGFSHFRIGKKLYISPSSQALISIKENQKSLQLDPSVQEVISNLPKNNIVDLYFNHNLISSDLNALFNITAASLRESQAGLILSSYSSPAKGTVFPYTRQKYLAKIPQFLPNQQLFFLGGKDATPRLLNMAKNLPQFKGDSATLSNQILSILNSYDLSINSLKVLSKVFSNEYAITLNQDGDWSLIFNNLSRNLNQQTNQELNNLTAYFNPIKTPYELGDGSSSSLLTPDPDQKGIFINSKLQKFDLAELDKSVYWGIQEGQYSYFSTSYNPFLGLSLTSQKLSQNKFFETASDLLLPYADEVMYVDKNFLHPFVSNSFDLKDIPNIYSISNFFTDGLQTITLMQW